MNSRPLRRVLVANRGEIAVRIVRACSELGLESVVPVSDADRESLAARTATRSICIGPARSSDSYLRSDLLVHAALATGCDAVHPGYGFLSERAEFASACERHDLVFVGPTPISIESMGDKSNARAVARKVGVPIVPGRDHVGSAAEARASASEIGLPVLLKAKAGGGGRGMRVVTRLEDVEAAYAAASSEALAAFGDASLYLERYIERGRHVEVQVLGDGTGRVLHCFERDCSVQRRHQKLIEETPSPRLPEQVKKAMLEAAVRLASAVSYRSAGTIEFIVDDDTHEFFFLEMNTRIQVEHPVTEMSLGVDLVQSQLRLAMGQSPGIDPGRIAQSGHVIECRINAENPACGFAPSPGLLTAWRPPAGEGIRVDTHCFTGYTVPPFYDSLIAKVIVRGSTREGAITAMKDALRRFEVRGVATTIAFHLAALGHADFVAGRATTRWAESTLMREWSFAEALQ